MHLPYILQKKEKLSVLLLFFCAAVSSFWYYHQRATLATQPAIQWRTGAEGVMKAITLQEFDKNGFPVSSLAATDAYQYTKEAAQAMVFTQPFLDLYAPNQQHWQVLAKSGEIIDRENSVLVLKGNVHADEVSALGQHLTQIVTDQLDIEPKKKLIHSNSAITIAQDVQNISAHGFEADLNSGKIRLYSGVQGSFRIGTL